jgi:hypothetical protein
MCGAPDTNKSANWTAENVGHIQRIFLSCSHAHIKKIFLHPNCLIPSKILISVKT